MDPEHYGADPEPKQDPETQDSPFGHGSYFQLIISFLCQFDTILQDTVPTPFFGKMIASILK